MAQSSGVRIVGPEVPGSSEILTPDALEFVAGLQRALGPRRSGLLQKRVDRQAEIDAGATLGLLPETAAIRLDPSWRLSNGGNIARIIAEFQQRAVTSASRYGDEAEILRALDLALEDLRETENRRRTLSKTQTIRRQTESLLGFGASSPAGNSWSGG